MRGLIRNPDHAADLEAQGALGVVADLEEQDVDELADAVGTADAIVFAAGAGPGTGPQRKWTVDYAGAVKLMEVARRNQIDRYVIVSSIRADPEAEDDGAFGTYLKAKGKADQKLMESGLSYTIVRPGRLTDDPADRRDRARRRARRDHARRRRRGGRRGARHARDRREDHGHQQRPDSRSWRPCSRWRPGADASAG